MKSRNFQAVLARRGVWALACFLVGLPGISMAVDITDAKFAGAEGGDWGGQNGAVIGPPDGTCANMGALGKENLAFNFGFNIPEGATPIAATAFIKAASKGGQIVHITLVTDVTAGAGPEELQKNFYTANVPTGSCAETAFSQVPCAAGNGEAFCDTDPKVGREPGDLDSYWGLAGLTREQVNAANFGMVLEKAVKSEVKVDALCLEITYSIDETTESTLLCDAPPPVETTLTLVKNVTNDNDGTAVPGDWTLYADAEEFTSGETKIVADGTYELTESVVAGYSPAAPTALSCFGDGTFDGAATPPTITLAEGDSATCTFFNDDDPPATATLTLVKDVTNDYPGENKAVPNDWTLRADGQDFVEGETGVSATVEIGSYTLSEVCNFEPVCDTGYEQFNLSCDDGTLVDDVLTLAGQDDATCTFFNRDLPPPPEEAVPVPVNGLWMQLFLVFLLIGTAWYVVRMRAGRS